MGGFSIIGAICFTAKFLRGMLLPDKHLNAVNDLGKPLILGNPNRGYMIRHTTQDGRVYLYQGDGWYNLENGRSIEEDIPEYAR